MSGSETRGGAARPRVGLSCGRERARSGDWDLPAVFLPASYIDAVSEAGGGAVVLPVRSDTASADAVVADLDALVLTGGPDLDPARYGALPAPETDEPRADRDAWESALLAAAIRAGLPVLGVCRGAQLLNIAQGGTLIQHLPTQLGHSASRPGGGRFGTATVVTEPDTLIRELLEGRSELDVPVSHHQAIDRVAPSLQVTARSTERVVQAVELAGAAFCLGVQWHPEEDRDDRRIFAGLVAAGRRYRAERERRGP